jgi:hypothetical protein
MLDGWTTFGLFFFFCGMRCFTSKNLGPANSFKIRCTLSPAGVTEVKIPNAWPASCSLDRAEEI